MVILGARGVGKSTFIQKALDVSYPSTSRAAERKIHVKESDYFVRLLEVALDDVDWDEDDETVIWPETIEDKMMPRIDGTLVLYDIKDKNSLENVPEMLSKCGPSRLSNLDPKIGPSLYIQYGCLLTLCIIRGNQQGWDTLGTGFLQMRCSTRGY